jgi:hypothetical protein
MGIDVLPYLITQIKHFYNFQKTPTKPPIYKYFYKKEGVLISLVEYMYYPNIFQEVESWALSFIK